MHGSFGFSTGAGRFGVPGFIGRISDGMGPAGDVVLLGCSVEPSLLACSWLESVDDEELVVELVEPVPQGLPPMLPLPDELPYP